MKERGGRQSIERGPGSVFDCCDARVLHFAARPPLLLFSFSFSFISRSQRLVCAALRLLPLSRPCGCLLVKGAAAEDRPLAARSPPSLPSVLGSSRLVSPLSRSASVLPEVSRPSAAMPVRGGKRSGRSRPEAEAEPGEAASAAATAEASASTAASLPPDLLTAAAAATADQEALRALSIAAGGEHCRRGGAAGARALERKTGRTVSFCCRLTLAFRRRLL